MRQAKRRQEVLDAILAREKAKAAAKKGTFLEVEEDHASLKLAEQLAQEELQNLQASGAEAVPKDAEAAGSAPELIPVKQELTEGYEVEPVSVLSGLRFCHKCKSRSYLRQGLCTNLLCPLYFMKISDGSQRLCAKRCHWIRREMVSIQLGCHNAWACTMHTAAWTAARRKHGWCQG